MLDEQLFRGTSPIHALDPRLRLVLAVLCSVVLAVLTSLQAALAGLGAGIVLLALARPAPGPLARRLVAVNAFILFLWLTVPWSVAGEPLRVLGPVTVTREGVQLALMVTIKSNAMILVFLALVASMPLPTLGAALEKLRCPSRLIVLLLFAYRYLFVLFEEWQTMYAAARLRGFVPGTNMHTYRSVANMLGMLFVRSAERAQRIWEAMCLRGFCGRFGSMALFRLTRADLVMAAITLPVLAAILLID